MNDSYGFAAGRTRAHSVENVDLIVVGLGTVGAFAFLEAARRGLSVVGLEQQPRVDHQVGASGGRTRIFRLAYKEGAAYVPMLRESLQRWEELQRAHDEPIWQPHGALMIGNPSHPAMVAFRDSVSEHRLNVEWLGHSEFRRRWPQHRLLDSDVAYLDPNGGLLRPQAAIRAAVNDARAAGGRVATLTRVLSWSSTPTGPTVETSTGIVRARRLLLACGPWSGELVPALNKLIKLLVVPLHWFTVTNTRVFDPAQFPVGIRYSGDGASLSFFPAVDADGMKVNLYQQRTAINKMPERSLEVPAALSAQVSQTVARLFHNVAPFPNRAACFVDGYTSDKRPLFTRLAPNAMSVTGLSGQGFKMAPAIARLAVDLLSGADAATLRGLPIRMIR